MYLGDSISGSSSRGSSNSTDLFNITLREEVEEEAEEAVKVGAIILGVCFWLLVCMCCCPQGNITSSRRSTTTTARSSLQHPSQETI